MITVFSKQWFKKYKSLITRVARLPILGEFIFSFKKFGHYVDRKKIVEVTPNSVIEFVSWKKGYKEVELRQHFFVRNEYALRLQKVFYPIWIVFHTWDNLTRFAPQLNLGFDTLTVYPDAHPESTSVDGHIQAASASWATAHDDDGTIALGYSDLTSSRIGCAKFTNYIIYRAFLLFDTSALTSEATISVAVLSPYITAHNDDYNDGYDYVRVITTNPASNTDLVPADYAATTTTQQSADKDLTAGITDSAYNDFTLNATGLSNVSKIGISKFGIREGHDIDNQTIGDTSGTYSSITMNFADNGTDKPKLVVTYTVGGGVVNIPTLLTLGVG